MSDLSPTYTLQHLVVFVAVAESGSISGAAGRLHLSSSAVSTAITDLEKRLGVQLCVRLRAKGVQLTPTGTSMLDRARAVLREATQLQHIARGGHGAIGPVRVGCYSSLAPTLLPPLVEAFTLDNPEASVDLLEEDQDELRHLVDRGELDLALVYALDLPPEWAVAPLYSRSPRIVLAASHPLAACGDDGVDLADLADEPMVLLDAPPSSNHAYSVCARAGFSPRVTFRTRSFESARAFVGRGLGWTLLLQRPAEDSSYTGDQLAVLPIATPVQPDVTVGLARRADAPQSAPARAFTECAHRVVRELAGSVL